MADGKLMGCWGAVVGLVLLAVLGWMTLDLATLAVTTVRDESLMGLAVSSLFLHELGELLVVGALLVGVYVAVLRPPDMGPLGRWSRPVCWTGAALQAVAWWGLAGTGLRGWALALLALGVAGTPALEWLAGRFSPEAPPGTPPDLRT